VALEGNVEFSPDIPEDWREYVALDVGGLAGGYGWVFPKGEHLNVGVGAWKYAGFTLRPKLAELCRRYGFDAGALTNLRGHHLPVRVPGSPVARCTRWRCCSSRPSSCSSFEIPSASTAHPRPQSCLPPTAG